MMARRLVARSILLVALAMAGAPARAAEPPPLKASPWVTAPASRVRLIVPDQPPQGVDTGHAAVEIEMAPDSKTYWRNPGETGVPTTAGFEGSTGLATIRLAYPVPIPFDDGSGSISLGYKERATFPILFTRGDGAARLSVTLDYGVCTKSMCIPAQAKIDLGFGEGSELPGLQGRLEAALKAVPVIRPLGSPDAPGVLSLRPSLVDGKVVVDILVRPASGDSAPVLFVDAQDYFSVEPAGAGEDRTVRFRAVSGNTVEAGKPLGEITLVVASGGKATETHVNLDEVLKRP